MKLSKLFFHLNKFLFQEPIYLRKYLLLIKLLKFEGLKLLIFLLVGQCHNLKPVDFFNLKLLNY